MMRLVRAGRSTCSLTSLSIKAQPGRQGAFVVSAVTRGPAPTSSNQLLPRDGHVETADSRLFPASSMLFPTLSLGLESWLFVQLQVVDSPASCDRVATPVKELIAALGASMEMVVVAAAAAAAAATFPAASQMGEQKNRGTKEAGGAPPTGAGRQAGKQAGGQAGRLTATEVAETAETDSGAGVVDQIAHDVCHNRAMHPSGSLSWTHDRSRSVGTSKGRRGQTLLLSRWRRTVNDNNWRRPDLSLYKNYNNYRKVASEHDASFWRARAPRVSPFHAPPCLLSADQHAIMITRSLEAEYHQVAA